MTGKDWIYMFTISLRSPEATRFARAQRLNLEAVQCFFALCVQELGDEKYGPDSIYNLDETVQNLLKVIAAKGVNYITQNYS